MNTRTAKPQDINAADAREQEASIGKISAQKLTAEKTPAREVSARETLVQKPSAPQETAIRILGLQKSFKGTKGSVNKVLEGLNLEVRQGEIFALLGSNGSGKTTTVRILSTLLKADGGSASVGGFDVSAQAHKVRECISLTGQFTAVDEILTGRENLTMIAKLRGISDIKKTVDDLIERFALTDAADRRCKSYSGGMVRKLDIAMSLIGTPRVIFLDEPTTGLDPEARLEAWKTVKELAQGGTTIFLTTQYLEEAEHLADRIAILHSGKIIACGTLVELKELFPPAKVEYIEKQPSLEDIFLSIIGKENA